MDEDFDEEKLRHAYDSDRLDRQHPLSTFRSQHYSVWKLV